MVWWKWLVETLFGFGLLINAVLFIPQIIQVYRAKHAQELSLLTFAGFNAIQVLMILQGILFHDWVLVGGGAASLLTCGCITTLIIFYRLRSKPV